LSWCMSIPLFLSEVFIWILYFVCWFTQIKENSIF